MVEVTHSYGYPVKSIMENAMLTDEQLAIGCQCAAEAGVDFVKAASGRGGSPRMETIYIMRANIPDHVGIKFAGYGTYNLTQLTIMGLVSGADLFGTGYAHDIIEEIDRHYKDLVINNK
jgi:deoxyribose-phosphate aldolase